MGTTALDNIAGSVPVGILAGDPIDRLIAACEFDEYDTDIGTCGLCGVFAIALHRELARVGVSSQIELLCAAKIPGQASYQRSALSSHPPDIRGLYWRHVMLRVGDRHYDIEGHVHIAHAIENYCIDDGHRYGVLMPVTFLETTRLIRDLLSYSYDRGYHVKWRQKIRDTLKIQSV